VTHSLQSPALRMDLPPCPCHPLVAEVPCLGTLGALGPCLAALQLRVGVVACQAYQVEGVGPYPCLAAEACRVVGACLDEGLRKVRQQMKATCFSRVTIVTCHLRQHIPFNPGLLHCMCPTLDIATSACVVAYSPLLQQL
jgi:hypothetical protein